MAPRPPGPLAEFERDLTRERTHAGLTSARARARIGGRPEALTDPKQVALAQALSDGGRTDVDTICRTLGIWRAPRCRSPDRSAGGHSSMNDSAKEL